VSRVRTMLERECSKFHREIITVTSMKVGLLIDRLRLIYVRFAIEDDCSSTDRPKALFL